MTVQPYGLCRCGCGERTSIAPQTKTSAGWKRGEPVPYRPGHNLRGRPAWNRSSDVDYVVDANGCWVWQLRLDAGGYAVAHVRSRPVRAARRYYERHVGPIPEGLHIDHLCRNRACVNPDHLEPVTPAENVRRQPTIKVTAAMALEIARTSERGVDIARRLGISPQQVCNIRKGRCWADVTGVEAA